MASIIVRDYPMSKQNFTAWNDRVLPTWTVREYPTNRWILFINGCLCAITLDTDSILSCICASKRLAKMDVGVISVSPTGIVLDWADKLE